MKAEGRRRQAAGSKNVCDSRCCAFVFNRLLPIAFCLLSLLLLSSCGREKREFNVGPAAAGRTGGVGRAGGVSLDELGTGETKPAAVAGDKYEENAYAMNEGKRLFEWFNCTGCHAHGGGGMGPPLMDDRWLYGGQPAQVFQTIVEGRPNGMPSFRGKIPDHQVWQLSAYVRSMSGQVRMDAAPGRKDDMSVKKPEQRKGKEEPKK